MTGKGRKRLCLLAAVLAALALGSFAVPAEELVDKAFVIVGDGVNGVIPEPDAAAFWECPMLSAGQARTDGQLRITNDDKAAVDVRLKDVVLPYGDEEALAYLDALRIRVTDGDTVLYDGAYTRIAEEGGLELTVQELPRGSTRTFGIELYCSFAYTGQPIGTQVRWDWEASPSAVTNDVPAPEQPIWVLVSVCVAGGLVILCGVLGALNLTKLSKKKTK